MATNTLFRGAASTTANTLLYTSPTFTAIQVENIAVTNTASSAATYTLNLAGVALASGTSIPANSTHYIDLSQVLYNGETITGSASATTVNFHIAGSDVL